MAKNNPKTYKDWKKGAVDHNRIFYNLQQRFGRGFGGLPTVPQLWPRNKQTKQTDPNAMDTSWRIRTRAMLTNEERDKLRKEGKCFQCRSKGHISRECPTKLTTRSGNAAARKISAEEILELLGKAEDNTQKEVVNKIFLGEQDFGEGTS